MCRKCSGRRYTAGAQHEDICTSVVAHSSHEAWGDRACRFSGSYTWVAKRFIDLLAHVGTSMRRGAAFNRRERPVLVSPHHGTCCVVLFSTSCASYTSVASRTYSYHLYCVRVTSTTRTTTTMSRSVPWTAGVPSIIATVSINRNLQLFWR